MKCPAFKFVPIFPCPATGHHWGRPRSVFFTLPSRYLYMFISLLLSMLSSPSSLNLSVCQMLLIIFWTCSSMSISLLRWGAKSWTQHSTRTSLGTQCPPSTCWCHSSQFSLIVDSSVNWSIPWGTWELSTQIRCAISHGCREAVVSLGFVSLLLSCCVDSSGSWERAATCGCSFLVCSAANGEMAALGSCLWKRVLDGVMYKEVRDLGEVKHRWQCCGGKDLPDFAILKF